VRPVRIPGIARRAVHLTVLSSFALAQPLFDILGRNATFFAARGSSGREIVLFALALTLVPPAVLILVELGAGLLDPILGLALHLLFVAALAAVIALQVLKRLDEPADFLLLGAGLLGVAAAVLYRRVQHAQSFLTLLAPAPLAFLALFLGGSDVSHLVFKSEPKVRAVHTRARTAVVLIVMDEFSTISLMDRNERIDARRFPHFAELARDATWYRTATTVATHTERAVPAILTGRVPDPHSLPTYADHPQNIFTLFGGNYRLHVFEVLTRLCPRSLCAAAERPVDAGGAVRAVPSGTGVLVSDATVVYLHLLLPDRLAARVTPIGDSWGDFKGLREGQRVTQARPEADSDLCGRGFCSLLQSITADRRRSLYFLHVLLPHVPWTYLPSGKRYTGNVRPIPGVDDLGWRHDDWLTLQAYQRYLLQLSYTDRALGRVLARLRAAGVYNGALIVVTPDHGLSFRPGEPRRDATRANMTDIAFVPLFVKLPGQKRGRIVDGFARTIDILPTIAAAVHAKIPWRVDGRSLLGRRLSPDGEVTLPDKEGVPITAPLSTLLAERRLALDRQIAAFGTGPIGRVYRIGPHRELLQKPVSELRVRQESNARVELDGPDLLQSVDLKSDVVPVYLTGKVRDGTGIDEELAIAVNGVVVATTRSYEDEGDERFGALLPEHALRSGQNDLRVFVLHSEGGSIVLDELQGTRVELVLKGNAIESGKKVVRIERGALRGEVHALTPGENIVIKGWAGDLRAHSPVDSLVLFVDGRSVATWPPSFTGQRIFDRYGIRRNGFEYELPNRLLPQPGHASRVRLFAIRGDMASELRYSGYYLTAGRG